MKCGPKNLQISFSGETLTHFAGLFLLRSFFQKINLRHLISHSIRFPQRNNCYSIAEEMLALIYPMILGLGRIEMTQLLKHNGVFQYLTGLPTYPNPTTLRRFLLRMAPEALPRLLATMSTKPKSPRRMIFDLDSTVLTLYGRQELAVVGYNPMKKGRKSYHPLLCFDGLTKDYWQGELRAGDAHTSSGVIELLREIFAKLPESVQVVIIRGDKGFFDHKTIEFLESRKAHFVIVARVTRPIKAKLSSLSYRVYKTGVEEAEFFYQPTRWLKPYRFIVIRRPIPEEPSEQLTLFSIGNYSYQVFVTDLKMKPLNIWRFYNRRAAVELVIKELKADYPLAKIPTRYFAANEAYFHLLLFAYNLVNWFKRFCLPPSAQSWTLKNLRTQMLFVPGDSFELPPNHWTIKKGFEGAFFPAAFRSQF